METNPHAPTPRRAEHRYRWSFGPIFRQDIYCTGSDEMYLVRYGLRLPFERRVYLHKFVQPDIPVFHDHPWNFASIILRGAYTEQQIGPPDRGAAVTSGVESSVIVRKRVGWLGWNRHKAEDLHFIEELEPPVGGHVWTLVFTSRRRRDWGFIVKGEGWLQWQRYFQRIKDTGIPIRSLEHVDCIRDLCHQLGLSPEPVLARMVIRIALSGHSEVAIRQWFWRALHGAKNAQHAEQRMQAVEGAIEVVSLESDASVLLAVMHSAWNRIDALQGVKS